MDKKLRDEAVRMALDIVAHNPLHITACWVEGCSPTPDQVLDFELAAAQVIREATREQLCRVYQEVVQHGDGEEPVAPSTLLCWLGDVASPDGSGLQCESVDLEVDR